MKIFTIFTATLLAVLLEAKAQIPNAGFEDWDVYPNYLEPGNYLTPNFYATGSFHPVTRSTDHFPPNIGNYSIRIENNTSLAPNNIDGFGIILQNKNAILNDGPGPYFLITGHPESLTGYFKYSPQNNDTMRIIVLLYKNGVAISGNSFISADTTADWTPFTVVFPNYVSADSCSILIAAYNADGHPPVYAPNGNSVLYIDNLNFDNLITSTHSLPNKKTFFNLYPNPTSDFVSLRSSLTNDSEMTLNFYNIIGKLVRSERLKSNQEKINIENLNSGVYILEIKANDRSEKQRLIIQ